MGGCDCTYREAWQDAALGHEWLLQFSGCRGSFDRAVKQLGQLPALLHCRYNVAAPHELSCGADSTQGNAQRQGMGGQVQRAARAP